MRHRRIARRLVSGVAALAVVAGALTACGAPAPATNAAGDELLRLYIGVPSPSPSQADVFWALHTGIFEDIGLDVSIDSPGAILAPRLASGEMIVGQFGTTGFFPGQIGGHLQSFILAEASGNNSGEVVVAADSPVKELEDLSGKTVGVVGASGSTYGAAMAYSNYIVDNGGEPFTIISQRDVATLTAAVSSGQVDAAVYSPVFGAAIAAGVLREVVNASDELAQRVQGSDYPATGWFGLKTLLSENHDKIVLLVAGIRIARDQIEDATDMEVAEVMAKDERFIPAVIATDVLAGQVTTARTYWSKDQGYVSKDSWAEALDRFSTWGLNSGSTSIDVYDPTLAFDTAVDMGFWDEATPIVEKYLTEKATGE